MKGAWKLAVGVVLSLAAGAPLMAENIEIKMKDGKTTLARAVRRTGNKIMATVEFPQKGPDGQPLVGEQGIELAQIDKIDFPEPTQLRTAAELILVGKSADALKEIEPLLKFYDGFREAPGSWWRDLTMLKVEALLALGNYKEAESQIDSLNRVISDPETQCAAKFFSAMGLATRGNNAKAIEMFDQVMKESPRPVMLALASVFIGQSYLPMKEYESALIAFLQIPIFYPNQKPLVPLAMLGCARAYYGLDDMKHARATLDELIKDFGGSPQAAEAKTELEKVAKREQALAPPK